MSCESRDKTYDVMHHSQSYRKTVQNLLLLCRFVSGGLFRNLRNRDSRGLPMGSEKKKHKLQLVLESGQLQAPLGSDGGVSTDAGSVMEPQRKFAGERVQRRRGGAMGGMPGGAGGGVGAVVLGPVERARRGSVEVGSDWDSDGECFSSVRDGGAGDCEEGGERGEGGDGGGRAAAGADGVFEHGVDVRGGVQCHASERAAVESLRVCGAYNGHFLRLRRIHLLYTRLDQRVQLVLN